MEVQAIAKESRFGESVWARSGHVRFSFLPRFLYLMSRDSLSFSWRSDDEVNIRHLLVVEHESISEQKQKSVSEEHQ